MRGPFSGPAEARARRKRREVAPRLIDLLSPVLRYSYTRRAWVVKGIGDRRGPVLVKRPSKRAVGSLRLEPNSGVGAGAPPLGNIVAERPAGDAAQQPVKPVR